MNNTATREELKTILDEWIPKYIRQVVELRSGSRLSAERYNELMNLLITQGDDTIELAETVKQYMELLVADEEAAREEFTQSVTQSLNETTAKITGIAENAVDTAESAVSSVNQYKTTIDKDMAQFKNTVNTAVSQMSSDIYSFKESVTQSIADSDARVNSAVATANQLTADMEAYRTELTQLTEQTFADMQTALSQQVSSDVSVGIASLKEELISDINTTISELEVEVMTIANTAEQAVNTAVQDIEAYKANMDTRLDAALKEVEDSLSVAGEVIQDASEIYAKIDEMNTLVNSYEDRVSTLEQSTETLSKSVATKAEASDVLSHKNSTANPHSVTKSQVGLGNVPNVATNDQTPTYAVASADAELTSGEKLSVAFGKIAKAVKSLISHLADTTKHITSSERTTWNNKAGTSTATASANGLMSSTDKSKLDGVAAGANAYTHPNSGVTAGTYRNVTVNAQGHVTAGSNPTITVAQGGTGKTTAQDAANAFINALSTGDSAPTDADYYVSQYSGGGTTYTTYHRRPMSALWSYIKGKADAVYAKVSHTHTKSQITDFPTSLPASDVYAWAKASAKPSYSWSEITSKPTSFTPTAHNQGASTITAGTFGGQVVAPAGTDYTTNRLRNNVLTTTDPGTGVSVSYVNGSTIDVYE